MSFEVWFEGTLFFFETGEQAEKFVGQVRAHNAAQADLVEATKAYQAAKTELDSRVLAAWIKATDLKSSIGEANCVGRQPGTPNLDSSIHSLCIQRGFV